MAYVFNPNQNANPAFGQSGPAVLALQSRLNTQNAGKSGYVPIQEDGKYGPLTQTAANFGGPGPGIVSTTAVANQFRKNSTDLSNVEANDPYLQLFAAQNQRNQNQEKTDIANTTAEKAREQIQERQTGQQYIAGIETAGIQSGASRYTPELYSGMVKQAQDQEHMKFKTLQDEENLAIAKAKQARQDNDAKTLEEQLKYVQDIRKAKQDALDNLQKMQWEQYKFSVLHGSSGGTDPKYSKANEIIKGNPDLDDPSLLAKIISETGLSVTNATALVNARQSISGKTAATQKFEPTAHLKNRLMNNGLDSDSIDNITTYLEQGKTLDEIFSASSAKGFDFTDKQKKILRNHVESI